MKREEFSFFHEPFVARVRNVIPQAFVNQCALSKK
ncbi:MAG: hypothetical protein QOI07_2018 [Verrucomicrobiota bacterium]